MIDIENAAGRVLLAGFEATEFNEEVERLLADVRPAGAIFFRRNVTGIEQFRELVRRVAEALRAHQGEGAPLLAVDQEGGSVDRFRDVLGRFPSAQAVATTGDDPFVRSFGAVVGEAMAGFGLNLNFAPMLDLATEAGRAALGTRAVSGDPRQVVRFARNFLAGLARWGITGCGKHFPGLGSGAKDTHFEMAEIDQPAEQLWESDMLPFREMHGELPLIMACHAWFPSLHPEGAAPRSASLSREVITGWLRERAGFQGVIVADDLEMGAVEAGGSAGPVAVAAIEAGCDLLPVCRTPEKVREAYQALVERAGQDEAFAARLREAAARVEALQKSIREKQLVAEPPSNESDWQRVKEAIEHLREAAEHMGQAAASTSGPLREGARVARAGGGRGRAGGGGGGGGRGGPRGGRRDGPPRGDGRGRPGGRDRDRGRRGGPGDRGGRGDGRGGRGPGRPGGRPSGGDRPE